MPRTSLTRRVTFAAAHRYRRPDWSDQKHAALFGARAHPHSHGLTYRCDVTAAGPVDADTGFVVDLGFLDRVLRRELRDRFDHRPINLDVPECGDGRLIPTGEKRSRVICERGQGALAHSTAVVIRVHLAEDTTRSRSDEVDA
jgi:6-pyruvoyltetrahydropterin/6-carboxytetrahydropterin synthase